MKRILTYLAAMAIATTALSDDEHNYLMDGYLAKKLAEKV